MNVSVGMKGIVSVALAPREKPGSTSRFMTTWPTMCMSNAQRKDYATGPRDSALATLVMRFDVSDIDQSLVMRYHRAAHASVGCAREQLAVSLTAIMREGLFVDTLRTSQATD